jgi:hypothetical protein
MLRNADITILHEQDGNYATLYFKGVSWRGKRVQAVTDRGLEIMNVTSIRIPTDEHIGIGENDFVAKGIIAAPTGGITAWIESNNALKIIAVSDNTQAPLPHWRIDAQ